jgi:hypothetical protein
MSIVPTDTVIGIVAANGNNAPFVFQLYAKDFYEAYKKHKGGSRFSPARLFLLCRSIELAAKALHLGKTVWRVKPDPNSTSDPNIYPLPDPENKPLSDNDPSNWQMRWLTVNDLRDIGHDLEKACDTEILERYGINISETEKTELKKANKFYKGKGFEYYWFKFPGISEEDRSGPELSASGWKELPDENILEGLIEKLILPEPWHR